MDINPSLLELNSEVAVPSPAKLERSKKILSAAISTGQLTPEGEAWLKVATDPWHDTKIAGFRGIPDNYTGQSVTMSIVQEVNIKRPTALEAGNWDVRITTLPMASSVFTDKFMKVGNTLAYESALTSTNINPIQIDFTPSGSEFPLWGDSFSFGLQIPDDFKKGPYRVCGMGLEVINTTATLQQQGLATCAVMNQGTYEPFSANVVTAAGAPPTIWPVISSSFFTVKSPPQTLSEMMLLPGTTQWEAREGAYSVIQLLGMDHNPPTSVPEYPMFIDLDFDGREYINSVSADEVRIPHPQTGLLGSSATPVVWFPKIPGRVPMNSTIHMYTGLSDQTTLTVRVRWIIQRFPNDNEPEIVVLTQPSASWDPAAIEVHSRMNVKLPPAVMFRENPKGEWWKTMLAGIADIVGSGLMMMPHPFAKGAGAAITAGRAALLPNHPVQLQARATKNVVVPRKRKPQNQKGITFISPEELKKAKKKAQKQKKKAN